MKKIAIVLSIIAIVILAIILFLPSDNERIKATIKKGKQGIENENLSKIMSIFSIEYRDRYGLPYGSIRGAFRDLFSHVDDIKIQYTIGEIQIEDDTSRVLMDVLVTGIVSNSRQDIVGDEYETGRLELVLKKKYTRWLIITSEWKNPQAIKSIEAFPYFPLKYQ